jgi:hypothetical protein
MEACMKVLLRVATVVIFVVMAVSCRDLYTTSLGSALKRDSISIPSSTSISDLMDIAASDGTDPDVAKEILDVLAGKTQSDIVALSADDKSSILNLATTAAIDMKTLTNLATDASSNSSQNNTLIANALSAFDTSVDLTAIGTLLADSTTVQNEEIPIDSIIFASAVVLADAAKTVGTDAVMNILAMPSSTPAEIASRTAAIGALPGGQTQLNLIISVRDDIASRSDTDTEVAGFVLSDLLKGNQ